MLLSFINCSTYNISKESFVEQLSGKQTSTIQNVASLGLKYSSNQLKIHASWLKILKQQLIKNIRFKIIKIKYIKGRNDKS